MDSIASVFAMCAPLALGFGYYGWLAWYETKKNSQRLDAIETQLKELSDPTPPEDE